MNIAILYEFNDLIDFFGLIVEFIVKISEESITWLGDIEQDGRGFVNLCDLFCNFRFDEFIMCWDFVLEDGVLLNFFIVGMEEFNDSGRHSSE